MDTIQLLFYVLVIIPSAILHEYSHGWAADRLGDPTPRLAGRLTLNPIPHIDLWGTVLLPFGLFFLTGGSFLFAYAKPVPYNPLALRWQRWGSAAVGLAGPGANLIVAFGLGLIIRLLGVSSFTSFLSIVVYANILLALFNLIPVPPLDGSKLLYALLPDSWYRFKVWLERYSLVMLIVVVFFLSQWLTPLINLVFNLAVGS
jgi:Zn-dependent protease